MSSTYQHLESSNKEHKERHSNASNKKGKFLVILMQACKDNLEALLKFQRVKINMRNPEANSNNHEKRIYKRWQRW